MPNSYRVEGQATMLRLDGKPFSCPCGANVFIIVRREEPRQYRCNACGELYEAMDR